MTTQKPGFVKSLIPFMSMLFFIIFGYVIAGLRIELMFLAAAGVSGIVARTLGYTWQEMEEAIACRLKIITPAILIMWAVGIVIGTFMYSGSIPMIIYYGLQVIDPSYLIAFSFLICLLLSSVTGTAWGSAGTAGVAMIGISMGLGVPTEITAGAVISGAIFGDKMSPLSDTTNLCPAATGGVTLYEHIRHMWYTTLPASMIALIAYLAIGSQFGSKGSSSDIASAGSMISGLAAIYDFSVLNDILMLLPLLIILAGAAIRKPTVPVMLTGSLAAIAVGMACHGFSLKNGSIAAIRGFTATLADLDPALMDPSVVTLITRGGMAGMLGIIMIIYCGYAFTAIWSMTGGIATAFGPIVSKIRSKAQAIASAVFVTFLLDGSCGTSYVPAIIVPELFRRTFIENGLKLRNLSRTLEDAGTCLNPVWPWSMSGIFYATTFGIATWSYTPWAFLCILTPFIALFCGFTGWGIALLTEEEKEAELKRIGH